MTLRSGLIVSVFPALLLTSIASADILSLPVTYRDFTPQTHPDFEYAISDDRNMVLTTLGPDGKPVFAHAGPTATVHGPDSFASWFNDVPGVNIPIAGSIELDNSSPGPGGIYRYTNNDFFPLNGQGFGNYGETGRNFHFTMQMHAQFTYQAGQMFSFTGDDDVWVYINKQLVIDLGGVHGPESASVNLDTLGLTIGETYDFDFFFAERHTSGSTISIETSIVLIPAPASCIALSAIGLIARRRR